MISFKGRHFQQEMILQSVHWYLAYSLYAYTMVALVATQGGNTRAALAKRYAVHPNQLKVTISSESSLSLSIAKR
jgi:hypothetical protein